MGTEALISAPADVRERDAVDAPRPPAPSTSSDYPLRGPERAVFGGSTRRSAITRLGILTTVSALTIWLGIVTFGLTPRPLGHGLSFGVHHAVMLMTHGHGLRHPARHLITATSVVHLATTAR